MKDQRNLASLQDDIQKIKDWLKKQPHLPHDIDDELLTCFVHGTKSLEIAKKKLDSYFTIRGLRPKLFEFSVRDPLDPDFQKANSSTRKFFLDSTTPEGYRVLFHNLTPTFNECFVHSQEIVKSMMCIEMAMHTWPDMKGLYLVYDMKTLDATLLTKLAPTLLGSALDWFQSSVPVKLKGVLIFNAPTFLEKTVDWLLKPFMKPKLFQRLKVTSEDKSCVKKYLPEEILPSDYGGTRTKSSNELTDEWIDLILSKRSWFQRTSNQIADEKKRPPDENDTYGVQGTFRTLALD
ncbi:alpha-tocopherol transfer protein-like [Halyomorpha halys]|uniref:alpha-tocopherol transfer protein-like n=1 Tax=Halyomorpha halys TaxID=286706 RepID=UPI000D0C9407|nr:alpha-tocopherol transfer protein-like [Halyomorpha halys]